MNHNLIRMGRRSYIGPHAKVHTYGDESQIDITIGAYCSIADDVEFLPGGMHELDKVSTYPWQLTGRRGRRAYQRGPIRVGNDVWIGRGAKILGGATVEDGAIIAAWAVVAGHVPAYHVAIGNPARYRPRPHVAYADQLRRIAWWDWADDDPRLDDVELLGVPEFCAKYDPEGSRQ